MIYKFVVVRLVVNYGNMRAVPVGPMATSFARIAGAKTLTPDVLREISDLGFPVAADGSTEDVRYMEKLIRGNNPLRNAVLVGYQRGMEDELDNDLEFHLGHKMEHGT